MATITLYPRADNVVEWQYSWDYMVAWENAKYGGLCLTDQTQKILNFWYDQSCPSNCTINSITLYVYYRAYNSPFYFTLNDSAVSMPVTGTFDTRSYTWSGSGWTPAAVNSLYAGVKGGSDGGSAERTNAHYIIVDYTAWTVPAVTTNNATNVLSVTATLNGNVTSGGGGTIQGRGFAWGTAENPTRGVNSWKDVTGTTGAYSLNIASLTPNTTYYVRAYAWNVVGTTYGTQTSFRTTSRGLFTFHG
mgnify:CR=1 FL=1